MKIRISGTISESIVDGPGIRFVVFTQGCPHHCAGCHNPDTHDFNGGKVIDTDEMIEEMKLYPYMSGLTISGGEPFSQKTAILRLIFDFKTLYPNKNIVVFSGYRMEELIEMDDLEVKQILDTIDYLIDGRFDLKLKDISLVYRGSSNQRIIDMKKTKQAGKIIIKEF
jgi:anaerobic ribonucleoside-triphosphate reductase activating protein